jgi:molybdopterin synthase catalytic subunit
MFQISNKAINHNELALKIEDNRAGAMVFFDGRVRNHNEGHQVNSLEYQCYESMAIKEGTKIVKEALDRFDIHEAHCVHREGHLQITDVAVWVGVSSSHRQEAFEASQYIIDEVKSRVPMWKKEHYVDLPAQWVECHRCAEHTHHNHEHKGELHAKA